MSRQTLTITLEAHRKAELDRLAEAQGRNRDALIDEALANWLALQTWQTREIEAGLADAESGDFASEAEIESPTATADQAACASATPAGHPPPATWQPCAASPPTASAPQPRTRH